jgi:hypothetical protein
MHALGLGTGTSAVAPPRAKKILGLVKKEYIFFLIVYFFFFFLDGYQFCVIYLLYKCLMHHYYENIRYVLEYYE